MYPKIVHTLIAAACTFVGLAAHGDADVLSRWHLAPFWEGTTMHGESCFFLEETAGAAPTSTLLFTPKKIRSVVHTATGTTYEEGRDYTLDRETRRLTLTKDTRIPFTTRADYEPPVGKSGQLYRDGTRDIFFENEHRFHDLQVEVTYEHKKKDWTKLGGPVPESAGENLPDLNRKLAAGEPLTVCLLGDSISFGLNASGVAGVPPHQPAYGDLFVQGLSARFGSVIDFTNFSVSGMGAPWGIEQAPLVAEKKPDLVIIAFGMNDASGRFSPADFTANIQRIMDGIKAGHPATSFIVVSPMLGNVDWKHAAPDLYPQYRDALMTLRGPGVAVADLTSFWSLFLQHKRFVDIAGNGVNHPNDFGYRVYAQVLLALFPESLKG